LLLSDTGDDADEAELTAAPTEVDVDISLSAHANAQQYFNQKKQSVVKKQKTADAVDQVWTCRQQGGREGERERESVCVCVCVTHLYIVPCYTQQALKAAEKKARVAIKEVHIKANILKVRKTLWFEKFYWFISSDNYLVISGRDAQQNEVRANWLL
jgi:predicted ribosome quality control (RQC) complex YloA/Tae2 family protein